jgi:hypothetical protein
MGKRRERLGFARKNNNNNNNNVAKDTISVRHVSDQKKQSWLRAPRIRNKLGVNCDDVQ